MASEHNNEEVHGPTFWQVIPAINGRGELLLGPDPYARTVGAIVFAPPGVLLRGPLLDRPLTRDGWRVARWGLNEFGHLLIDQGRPFALERIELGQAVEDVAEHAPDQLGWIAGVVERQLRLLLGRMRLRDFEGRLHPRAGEAFGELQALKAEADTAFDRIRGRLDGARGWWVVPDAFAAIVADGYLPALERLPVHAPGADPAPALPSIPVGRAGEAKPVTD